MSGSIATRLITVLTLCSVPILGLGLVLDYRLSRQELLTALENEARDTINAVVIDLENMLDGVEASTGLLGRILQQRRYSQQGLAQMLHDAVQYNEDLFGGSIALLPSQAQSAAGFAPYFYRGPNGLARKNLAAERDAYWDRPWFADALRRGAPVWSEPYFDRGGGGVWMTTYSVPVLRADEQGQAQPYAVVTGDVPLAELRAYLQRVRPGSSGFAFLLSRGGKVLSPLPPERAPGEVSQVIGREVTARDWEAALQALDMGQVIARDIPCPHRDGQCALRMRLLHATGWPVGVIFSEQEILAPLRAFEIKAGAIGLATLLVMALAVFLVTRRITRPLSALARASDAIARGELNAPLPAPRGRDEVATLVRSFASMQQDLERYIADLESVTAGRARLEGELAAAADIQMAMLPGGGRAFEAWDEACLWAAVRPARSVGGDLYSYRRRGRRLVFAVGDVSDKGVPAALFMARAMSLVQQLADESETPSAALSQLNDALQRGNDNCMFLTLCLGVLDLGDGQLSFASAGHAPPALLRAGRVSFAPQQSGPALGLARGLDYPLNHLQLLAGDRLALYTDGIDEAFDPRQRMFGVEGLVHSLEQGARLSVADAGAALIAAVDAHSATAPQSDDITLLLLDFAAGQSGCGAAAQPFAASAQAVQEAVSWTRDVLLRAAVPAPVVAELQLVAEELVSNVVKYAGLQPRDTLEVSLQWRPDAVALAVSDPGRAFDPLTEAERAVRGAAIDSAEIGGLGVHLVTQLTDRQDYRRQDGRNVLRVTRHLRQDLSRESIAHLPEASEHMELTTTVSVDPHRSLARVALDGALNTDTAPAFEQRLQAVVEEGHALIVLDMKDLEYISSAGLRVIFKAAKQTSNEGRRLAAANRKPHIDKVFEILKALPDMAVFANDEELDEYLTAMQEKTRAGD